MLLRKLAMSAVMGIILALPSAAYAQQKIYWADDGTKKIQCANIDGTNQQDLATGLSNPRDVAVNKKICKLYWTDAFVVDKIFWDDLDGSNIQEVPVDPPLNNPSGLAFDYVNDRLYWTETHSPQNISSALFHGPDRQDHIISGLPEPWAIAVDGSGNRMYWTDNAQHFIESADLDGNNRDVLISTGITGPGSIKLHVAEGKMYWADEGSGSIKRADLDGSNMEDCFQGLDSPRGLDLDLKGDKVYWSDVGTGKIQRGNLDCTGAPEDVVTGLMVPTAIALEWCAPIPTVSEWGLIVMMLLLLSAGTVVFRARRTTTG